MKNPELGQPHSEIPVDSMTIDSILEESQQVHTTVYLNKGFINGENLNSDGLYLDEYTHRAEPILVKLGAKETTLRMIHADKKQGGILSLPTPKHFEIDPTAIRDVAQVSRLSDISHKDVVELSGLARITIDGVEATRGESLDASRQAYAIGLRRSLDQGHKLWVMNVDERMKRGFGTILGDDAMVQIGGRQEYLGPPTIPVAMNPQEVVRSILTDEGRFGDSNRADIQNTLNGVSERHLPRKLVNLLHEHDIETQKDDPISRVWRNKKLGFYGVIVGYSALRFVPVGAVEQFDGDVGIYAAIDVGTALTQVGSMELFLKGKNRAIRSLGILGTAASFAAPYAYFYANGNEYPAYVNAVAAGFAAVGIGLETDKTIRDNKIKKGLEATDIPSV